MTFSAPYDHQNLHHFVVSSFHFVALWTVLGMALWMELGMALGMALGMVLLKELLKELESELEMVLCLLTFWTLLSMPYRHFLLAARVPVWVLALAPPKALSASPSQVDKSTFACRSRSRHLADRPILVALIAYLAPSVPLFGARAFSGRSRAGAVSSPLSLCQWFS